jgi:hypothetical protein
MKFEFVVPFIFVAVVLVILNIFSLREDKEITQESMSTFEYVNIKDIPGIDKDLIEDAGNRDIKYLFSEDVLHDNENDTYVFIVQPNIQGDLDIPASSFAPTVIEGKPDAFNKACREAIFLYDKNFFKITSNTKPIYEGARDSVKDNIGGVVDMVKGVGNTIRHPIDTTKSVINGVSEKFSQVRDFLKKVTNGEFHISFEDVKEALLPSYSNSGHFLFDLRPGRRLICLKMLANC